MVESNEQNLEETLKEELIGGSQFPLILICGVRNSGKTFTALKILNILLKESNIKKFHIVLPVYRFEQNDSYSFLGDYEQGKRKDGKVCFIYPKFKDSLVAAICAKGNKGRLFRSVRFYR